MDDLHLIKLTANLNLSPTEATVQSEYLFQNKKSVPTTFKFKSLQPGVLSIRDRKPVDVRKKVSLKLPDQPAERTKLNLKTLSSEIKAKAKRIVDVDFITPIEDLKTKSFIFTPNILLDEDAVLTSKVKDYEVTMTLPKGAKRLVSSSVPVSKRERSRDGLKFVFKQKDVYPLPISVKWTEHPENISVSKTMKRITDNRMRITLRVKNLSDKPASKVFIKDQYPAADVMPVKRELFTISRSNDKDNIWTYKKLLALKPRETKILTYTIKSKTTNLAIEPAAIFKGNDLIAVSGVKNKYFEFSPIPMLPKDAFALPSGWSFDFKHGGDHHINEHGMWCSGENYNPRNETLNWTTGCIYADKNFDDDYRWQAHHQIVRFNPGSAIHRSSPWLSKSSKYQTVINEEFSDPSFKYFNNAIVLIRGWRFDFTSKDHHINKMRLKLDTISFDKRTGKVKWRLNVAYADKNYDDMFRFKYHYTILAFNGKKMVKEFHGIDRGGNAAHAGSITSNTLKGFKNGLVFPIGWEFDFLSSDHHINQHNFTIKNTHYNKANGEFRWTTHLNYSDRNFDDDYQWKYKVCLIATNDGESAEYVTPVISDNGGLDVKNFNISLNNLLKPITWTNGIKDGDEVGVDSGGSSPAVYVNNILPSINPGNAADSNYFSLKNTNDRNVVRMFATFALMEYALDQGEDYNTFYSGPEKSDRYVEAIAFYVSEHMSWVKDVGPHWNGKQAAIRTLTQSSHRGSKDFQGDCEDHAILRAALLRSLGFNHHSIFCADHHNDYDQGQRQECSTANKKTGGHTYNIVIYKGKYRLLDYGRMRPRYWNSGGEKCWDQHVTDNIWNDHTGKHWSRKDISPYGNVPLVNYPGNPSSPSSNWDWRTYYYDITPTIEETV